MPDFKFVIATTKRPTDFDAYLANLRTAVAEHADVAPLQLLGYSVIYGPGCYNQG